MLAQDGAAQMQVHGVVVEQQNVTLGERRVRDGEGVGDAFTAIRCVGRTPFMTYFRAMSFH